MAKRDKGTTPTNSGTRSAGAPDAASANAMEQRVVAFAEQLGRIVGTVQAKAEGWMDRDALSQQIANVRDGAADLLEQLAGGTAPAKLSQDENPAVTPARAGKGRSGGVVDAPGKKHRKPLPADPNARVVKSQAAKLRTVKTMAKSNRRRGRG